MPRVVTAIGSTRSMAIGGDYASKVSYFDNVSKKVIICKEVIDRPMEFLYTISLAGYSANISTYFIFSHNILILENTYHIH